jgi:nucleoside-diphosphate-sugar epimerase
VHYTFRHLGRFFVERLTLSRRLQLPQHEHRLATIAELQKTDLDWTRVHNGYFLDYFGMPHIESHMVPVVFAVDMEHKVAAIPGTGDDVVAFTYTKDLAKFVVAALDLPKWDESLFCYSDKVTWNQFLSIAEEMRGQSSSLAVRFGL